MTDAAAKPEPAHRFAFGDNWEKFSALVTQEQIREAEANLQRVLPQQAVSGKTFLDIGCGSGLHSLAAIKLGAKKVAAFDIDPQSVGTTKKILSLHAPDFAATVAQQSILDVSPAETYDIVYSWGVLHHTGAMWDAIKKASAFVAPGGTFVIAIYKKTPSCGFWRIEKSIYSRLPSILQFPVTALFSLFYLTGLLLKGTNPVKYMKTYKSYRGMNFWHDMIDWLGGYPYESATPDEIKNFVTGLGYETTAEYNAAPVAAFGLFGSGCAEYVFKNRKVS